jgi:hypothetical protein
LAAEAVTAIAAGTLAIRPTDRAIVAIGHTLVAVSIPIQVFRVTSKPSPAISGRLASDLTTRLSATRIVTAADRADYIERIVRQPIAVVVAPITRLGAWLGRVAGARQFARRFTSTHTRALAGRLGPDRRRIRAAAAGPVGGDTQLVSALETLAATRQPRPTRDGAETPVPDAYTTVVAVEPVEPSGRPEVAGRM